MTEVFDRYPSGGGEMLLAPTELDIKRERHAKELIQAFAAQYADELRMLWSWGDGYGGGITCLVAEAAGLPFEVSADEVSLKQEKQTIPASLSKQVFERDAYRCVHCGSWHDLCCDHVHPESRGGAATLDNLQTLCRSCNSREGVQVSD